MDKFFISPLFLVGLTLACYFVSLSFYKKYRLLLFHPVPLSSLIIILFLYNRGINYITYEKATGFISFFLGPATLALGYNLYRDFSMIRRRVWPILLGSFCGAIAGVFSVYILGKLLCINQSIIFSFLPKSTTTPIALAIATKYGGIGSLTVAAVVVTGILGALIGPEFLTLTGIRDNTARGLAMGSAAHAIGTSRALQENSEQGSLAGLAIILCGLFTALIISMINIFKEYIF
ncbi:LrgB family protein [Desulfofarcimen acetoxidans DSM 771]|jgi:predicted murein hydrolase (TIGR00659 family)|uniref:LrgB family protein n=1 Tax=Desulfofarcimen acetoxidans (strain ATCC 49208 / DSM 771 / KCTC 5769 / VKM B-1644 / 5575) TaxID=485916 RepID=C8VVB6_DESAS|nr:LrgB family protein [Desulfofarcimen acetoxidans]ACV60985.1 LrgB family protein [Desulfofarcimen acetoxidans DSM 771]